MLTEQEIEDIKGKLRKGDLTKIARNLGLSRQAIYHVLWRISDNSRIINALRRTAELRANQAERELEALHQTLSIHL